MGLGKTVADAGAAARRARAAQRTRKRLRPDAADLPDVGGRQLAARGRAVRAEPERATSITARSGSKGRAFASRRARRRSRDHDLRARGARPRDARRRASGSGVVLDEAQNIKTQRRQADAGDPLAARPPPGRADRHAGREPPRPSCTRSWTSSTRGCSARPRRSHAATRRRSSGYRDQRRDASACARRPARSSCAG